MSDTPLIPTSLAGDADGLSIVWSDGATHRLSWRLIRERCPCATCRAKAVEPPQAAPLLPVISLAETQPVRARGMHPVGNYAYSIDFTDGHNTGIYTLERLRELGETERGTMSEER